MTLAQEALVVLGAAFCAAILLMLACRALGMRSTVAWGVSLAGAYAAGQATMTRALGWSAALSSFVMPGESRDWLPSAAALAALITIVVEYAPKGWGRNVALGAGVLLVVGVPMRLLAGSVYVTQEWSTVEKLAHLATLAGCLGAVWWLLGSARENDAPRVRGGLLTATAIGAAIVLTKSGVAVYGQLAAVVGAAICGGAIAEWVAGRLRGALGPENEAPASPGRESGISGAGGVVAMTLGLLVMLGHYFAEVRWVDAGLLGVGAVVGGGWLPAPLTRHAKAGAALRVAVCLGAVGWAVWRCLTSSPAGGASPYAV